MSKKRAAKPIGRHGSAFHRLALYCPHCFSEVAEVSLLAARRLIAVHRPGLPQIRQPHPGERFWWCKTCSIPGSIA